MKVNKLLASIENQKNSTLLVWGMKKEGMMVLEFILSKPYRKILKKKFKFLKSIYNSRKLPQANY